MPVRRGWFRFLKKTFTSVAQLALDTIFLHAESLIDVNIVQYAICLL